jgi:AraC-like DNA-binding protein
MNDPLSSVLDMLDMRAAASARLEVAGQWGLSFPAPGPLKIIAVLAGRCWLTPAGAAAIALDRGDCVLLAGDRPFTAMSGPDQHALPQPVVLPGPWPPIVYYQTTAGGTEPERSVLVSGQITLDRHAAGPLLDDLPPAVRISASASVHRLGPVLEMLSAEAVHPDAPGASAVRRQLTQVLAVHALRALLTGTPGLSSSWLGALADQQIGAALTAIHNEPARRWTVAELAHLAAMSRSTFAARFRDLVGTPPLEYLIHWRMHRAAHALRTTADSVARIGASTGYPVETTFNNTFRRVIGQTPGRYRREFRLGSIQHGNGRTGFAARHHHHRHPHDAPYPAT